jgi:hypothetical protein
MELLRKSQFFPVIADECDAGPANRHGRGGVSISVFSARARTFSRLARLPSAGAIPSRRRPRG